MEVARRGGDVLQHPTDAVHAERRKNTGCEGVDTRCACTQNDKGTPMST